MTLTPIGALEILFEGCFFLACKCNLLVLLIRATHGRDIVVWLYFHIEKLVNYLDSEEGLQLNQCFMVFY